MKLMFNGKMRKIYLHTIIYTVLCMAMPFEAWSQVTIHGKVIDQANKPIEFATVKVKGTAVGTVTGLEGNYRLSAPKSDTIVVRFSCIGYEDESRTLVNPSGDITLNMRMREKVKELEQVEVTEIRKQTGSMQTIDATDYKLAADATGGSVESLLTTLAGVSSSNELSSQYSVRGGTYDENR